MSKLEIPNPKRCPPVVGGGLWVCRSHRNAPLQSSPRGVQRGGAPLRFHYPPIPQEWWLRGLIK